MIARVRVLVGLLVACLTVLALAAFPLPAFALSPAQVTVPPDVMAAFVAALTGLVAFLVTQGIKSLAAFLARYWFFKWINVSGWGAVITTFIVNGVLFYLDYVLGMVPVSYGPLVPWVFGLLIFLLQLFTSTGVHSVMKHVEAK